MKTIAHLLACCFLFCIGKNSGAQAPLPLDSSFSTPGFYTTQSGGMVSAAAAQLDGKMIVSGDFIRYNGQACTNLIRLHTDGARDTTFDSSAKTNGDITAIVMQPDARILLSGPFNSFKGAATTRNLIRLNNNGTYDSSFTAPANLRYVYATADRILVQPDSKILVGGFGVKTLNFSIYELIRLNGDGSIDNSFNVETGIQNYQTISALALGIDGKIYVGGSFKTFAGTTTGGLVRLNTNGSLDATFQVPGLGFTDMAQREVGPVTALLPLVDGSLLAGGMFYYCDNYLSPGVVRLLPNGSIDRTFTTGYAFMPYSITQMALQDNKVLLGGLFYSDNHQYMVLRLNANGSIDRTFQTVTAERRNNTAYNLNAMVLLRDSSISIAGGFNFYYGNKPYTGWAHLNKDGSLDTRLSATFQQIGTVLKTLVTKDGKIMVGGSFNLYGDKPVNNLARLLPSGALDSTFLPGAGPDALVSEIAELADSSMVVAGSFSTVNGYNANKIVKLKYGGTVDSSFVTGTGPDSYIYSLLPLANGKVMVGGSFGTFNGFSSRGVVRLTPTGAVDASFRAPATPPWYSVGSMAALKNNQLLVGDNTDRTVQDNTLPLRVWRLNEDASIDTTFKTTPQGGFPITYKLGVTPGDKIYYSGTLTNGSHFTQPLIRLALNGSNEPAARVFPNSFYVRDFKLLGDSAIMVCGRNLGWNDSANYIMRFKPDLSIDSSFNPVAVYYDIRSIDWMKDNRMVIAGEPVRFFRFATEQIPSIAVLKGTSLQVKDSGSRVANILGTLDVGKAVASGEAATTEVVISNTGSTAAVLGDGGSNVAVIEGANAEDFSIVQSTTSTSVGKGDSVVLRIRFTPKSTGVKTAQLTIPYNNGVRQKYTFQLTGTAQTVTTAVTNTQQDTETLLYPNPGTGLVYLKSSLSNYNLRVYDVQGHFLLQKRKLQAGQLVTLDFRALGKGIYWIELRNTKGVVIRQVVIQ